MSNNRGGPMLLSRKEMGDRGESRPGSGGGRGRGRGGRGGAGRGGAGAGSARNDVSEGMGRMQMGGSGGGEFSRGGRGGFRGGASRGGTGWQDGGRGGRGGRGGAHRGGGGHRGGFGGFSTGPDRPASDYLAPTAEQQMEQYAAGSQPATDDATLPQQLGKADRSKFEKVKLVSNIWELIVENRLVYRYDVNVVLVRADPERPRIDLTRRAGDDAARVERHELVRLALRRGLEMYRLLSERGAAVHDDAALLFTNECICEKLKQTGQLHIPLEQLTERARQLVHSATTSADVNEIVIEVRACAEGSHSFNMADVHQAVTTNLTQVDKSIKQFYELITNQDALVNGQHTLYGNGKLFNHNKRGDDLGFGHERKAGMSKGIKFVEGSGGPSRAVAALVLDYKVGTFFKATGLLSSVCELNGWRSASEAKWTEETKRKTAEYVKGLRLIYDKQSFVASGLSMQPLRDIEYKTVDGKMEKLITRFANLDQKIMFDSFPAVRRRLTFPGGFRDMHYPIELLQVAPNQRVPLDKQIAEPARPLRIDDRWRQIMNSLDELNLNGVNGNRYNEFMGRFGVSVSSQPMRVEGFRRPMPAVSYGRENAMVDSNMGDWRTGKTYAKAGQIGFWLVLYDDQRDEKIARTFVNVMMHHAASKGIKIEKNEVHLCKRDSRFSTLKQFFEMAKKNQESSKKLYFITYIDNEKVEGSHNALKLYERMFCVLSQQVNTARAMMVEKQGRTRDNIIAKWNEKIFGHNYVVKPEACANSLWMNGDVLIIGYDVCHPRPQTAAEKAGGIYPEIPSVVGFSFNGAEGDKSKFVGDYHFQEPKMEQVWDSVLNARIKWMLSRFQKINNKLPKKIVIVRDGVSEGQYRMVKEEEVAALREGIEEYGNVNGMDGLRIPLALIVVTKRHDLRLLAESNGRVEAPKPLTTVDSHVVRANQTEFFMQTHRPIQGTPKASCYNLLVNDLEMSMDEVQALMAALTFCHEISNGPTSIPEPVYQADEWAKRGKNNFVTLKKLSFKIPRKIEKGKSLDECEIDYETLSNKLSYWNTALEGTRANA